MAFRSMPSVKTKPPPRLGIVNQIALAQLNLTTLEGFELIERPRPVRSQ
jgi:hypothetical protein